jgi:hypothetical protein
VTKIDRLSFNFSDDSDHVWLRLVRRGASYLAHRRGKGTKSFVAALEEGEDQ